MNFLICHDFSTHLLNIYIYILRDMYMYTCSYFIFPCYSEINSIQGFECLQLDTVLVFLNVNSRSLLEFILLQFTFVIVCSVAYLSNYYQKSIRTMNFFQIFNFTKVVFPFFQMFSILLLLLLLFLGGVHICGFLCHSLFLYTYIYIYIHYDIKTMIMMI